MAIGLRLRGTLAADSLFGGQDDDTLYGGGGEVAPGDWADTLFGSGGTDWLYGNGGSDFLRGDGGEDTVFGGVGEDSLYGGSGEIDTADGSDALYGQDGADWLWGNAGADRLEGGEGADRLYAGLGDDTVFGGNIFDSVGDGGDFIVAGPGADVIAGGNGDDTIFGGTGVSDSTDGADLIDGGSGADVIYGNGGNDVLNGGDGHDTLYGGAGEDTLEGGAGNDVYVADTGDIVIGGAGTDRFVLNALSLSAGVQVIESGVTPFVIHLENAERGEEIKIINLNGRTVEIVSRFGAVEIRVGGQTLAEVTGSGVETIIPHETSSGNGGSNLVFFVNSLPVDTLGGGAVPQPPELTDVIAAVTYLESAVNSGPQLLDTDVTLADADDDTFNEGRLTVGYSGGSDAADQLFLRNQGSGGGQIGFTGSIVSYEGNAFATVSGGDDGTNGQQLAFDFDENATLAAVEALIENLTYANSSDTPTAHTVRITLNDGRATAEPTDLVVNITAENDAPVTAGITNQGVNENIAFSYALPAGTFTDGDGDTLTYSATKADNSALPGWLSFDAATQTFSGTPGPGDVGTVEIKVTATDTSSAAVSTNFFIGVSNVNDPPQLDNALADQTVAEDAAFSYTVPANSFSDPFPAGDVLAYSATLSSGAALPAWLSFNTATRAFSGTPLNANVGTINVKVTATDIFSASTFDTFDITVTNTNDAPTVATPIPNQTASEDSAFSFAFSSSAFTDVDTGDSLTYSVTSALPGWLGFNAGSRTFSGTPANGDVGDVDVTVRAIDGSATTVDDTFRVTVQDVNEAPVMTAATPSLTGINEDPTANNGDSISSLLGATVTDADAGAVEGIAITSTTGTGDWQYYDGASWINVGAVTTNNALLLADATSIRFVPTANASGAASFDYVAWDRSTGSAGSKVDVTTRGTTTAFSTQQNTASITVTAVNDAPTLSSATDITLTAINEDDTNPAGDTVTNLFSGRYVDTESAAFSGVAITANAATAGQGAWQYKVGAGAWTSIGTGITAATAVILDPTALLRFLPATNFNGNAGALTAALWDGTGTAFASGSTQNVTTLTNDAADPFSNSSLALTTSVTSVNDAPVLNTAVSDQFVSVAAGSSYTIPGGTFSDVDIATNGQSLSYTLEVFSGGVWTTTLPAGVSFAGDVITVAPGTAQSYYEMRVTATDDAAPALSAISSFLMGIADAAYFGTPGVDNLIGTAASEMIILLASADIAYGAAGNDTVFGNEGNDTIYGDTTGGGTAGADLIYGNDDNDNIYGDAYDHATGGADTLYGGNGNDSIYGYAGNDYLYGEAGTDSLYGGNGLDYIDGGEGTNGLYGEAGDDTILAGSGADILYGGDANDTISSGSGNDTIYGEAGADTLTSGDGSDTLLILSNAHSSNTVTDTYTDFTQGSDKFLIPGYLSISAGNAAASTASALTYEYDAGNLRTLVYGSGGALTFILAATPANPTGNFTLTATDFTFATHVGTESTDTITGSGNADLIYGFGSNDSLNGGSGNDTIYGGDGDDYIDGSSGVDLIEGGDGNDLLFAGAGIQIGGPETLTGGNGSDVFIWYAHYDSFGSIASPSYTDRVTDFQPLEDRIYLDAYNLTYPTFSVTGGQTLLTVSKSYEVMQVIFDGNLTTNGFSANNILFGNHFMGSTGSDYLSGSNSFQEMFIGNGGNDTVFGGAGTINTNLGNGDDTVVVSVNGPYENNMQLGNGNNSVISFNSSYRMSMGSGNNTVIATGTSGNRIYMGGGNDFVYANNVGITSTGVGNDVYVNGTAAMGSFYFGGTGQIFFDLGGNDTIRGAASNSTIVGGAGADQVLVGSTGVDNHWYLYATDSTSASTDLITAFNITNDKIFLHPAIWGSGGSMDGFADVVVGAYNAGSNYTPITLSGVAGFEMRLVGNYSGGAAPTVANFDFGTHVVMAGTAHTGTAAHEAIWGTAGGDTIEGGYGFDIVYAGDGDDVFYAGTLADTVGGSDTQRDEVSGEAGNDSLYGGAKYDSLNGGDGNDLLRGNDMTDWLYGGNNDDTLYGDAGYDLLYGEAGNDTIYGGAGYDIIDGGTGVDKLYGEAGLDFLTWENSDLVADDALDYSGAEEIDSLLSIAGTIGSTLLDGVDIKGIERFETANTAATIMSFAASYDDGVGADSIYGGLVVVDGAANTTTSHTLNIDATLLSVNTQLMGSAGNDTLLGGTGNDALQGGAGNDSLVGGNGNDTLTGGAGNDSMNGGAGNNVYEFWTRTDSTATATDTLYSFTNGQDKLLFNGIDFYNKSFSDLSISFNGTNTLVALSSIGFSTRFDAALGDITAQLDATDFIFSGYSFVGSATGENFTGTAGNDTITGGGGADTISGGIGQDVLTGGAGVDRFTFSAVNHSLASMGDTITNFDANADLLVFSGLLSGAFSFMGDETQAFAGGGNSSARFNDTSKLLEIDTNGDATADMAMTLTGVALADLSAADFSWS